VAVENQVDYHPENSSRHRDAVKISKVNVIDTILNNRNNIRKGIVG